MNISGRALSLIGTLCEEAAVILLCRFGPALSVLPDPSQILLAPHSGQMLLLYNMAGGHLSLLKSDTIE